MFGIQTFFISKSIGFLIRISIFSTKKDLLENELLNKFFFELSTIDWFALFLASIIQFFLFTKTRISQL